VERKHGVVIIGTNVIATQCRRMGRHGQTQKLKGRTVLGRTSQHKKDGRKKDKKGTFHHISQFFGRKDSAFLCEKNKKRPNYEKKTFLVCIQRKKSITFATTKNSIKQKYNYGSKKIEKCQS
jgi:hypothetical protein